MPALDEEAEDWQEVACHCQDPFPLLEVEEKEVVEGLTPDVYEMARK